MFRSSVSASAIGLATATAFALTAHSAMASVVLLDETFTTNPVNAAATVSGDNTRFTHNSGDDTLTAAYNTFEPTTTLRWGLGRTLTQNESFAFEARFSINSADFFADPNGFAQISFGLINSTTTGNDRSGYGISSFDGTNFTFDVINPNDTFDVASIDYFPNLASFASPSVQPVVFASDDGDSNTDGFVGITTPTSNESALDATGESDLPRDVFVTSRFAYDAATGRVTLTLDDAAGNPIAINTQGEAGPGGLDDSDFTIQMDLPPGSVFELDTAALLLWQDLYAANDAGQASVIADVNYDRFTVTLIPEPTAASVMLLGGSALLLQRRNARRKASS